MIGFLIFAILLILFLVGTIVYLSPGSKGKGTTVPGPVPSDKELGNLPDMGKAGSLHEYLTCLHDEYGTIVGFYWGQTFVVSIAHPGLFKEQAKFFDRPVELFKLFEPLIGKKSIQYANFEDGKIRRATYDKAFSHLSCLGYSKIIAETGKQLCNTWLQKTADDHIPVQTHIVALAVKAMVCCCYGNYMEDDRKILKFKQAYDFVWSEMEHRLTAGEPDENDPRTKKFDGERNLLLKYVKEMLDDRKTKKSKSNEEAPEFIDVLIENCENDEVMLSDALSYMIGGFHTTANAMTWALYYLSMYPETQSKLQKELDAAGGAKDLLSSTSGIESLLKLPYLRQVIDETLRCSALAPWAARFSTAETTLGGHKIPAETPVIHALGVVQHSEEFFSEADIFKPERMVDGGFPSMAFQPFGFAGKRKCPGYRFFYTEASVWLAQIFSQFNIQLAGEEKEVDPVYGLVTHPAEEIWIRLEKR